MSAEEAQNAATTTSTTTQQEQEQVAEVTAAVENVVLGEDGKPLTKSQLKKLAKEREKAEKKAAAAAKDAALRAAQQSAEPDFASANYGFLELNQSKTRSGRVRTAIEDINESIVGQQILMRARVQTSRAAGNKMCFFVLRQRTKTVQAVLVMDTEHVSKQFVKFAQTKIPAESIVLLEAVVTKPEEPVKSCDVHDYELKILKLHVESAAIPLLPLQLVDASRPDEEYERNPDMPRVGLDTRLDNRVIDLRTTTNQAIFRIQSAVCSLFREFLSSKKFVEIHTPKIIGAISEGGANVFEVSYFKTKAYLAQSPQLYKQMCVVADFERVFEIAPVFRAENSQTARHMTEFMGLDLEMAYDEHYHEVLELIGEMFIHIFKGLNERCAEELITINKQHPFEPLRFGDKLKVFQFSDVVKMLREAGEEVNDFDDLTTPHEKLLGKIIGDKYGIDFYAIDKYPLDVRAFYTMPDPNMPGYSNGYDFFIRGQEITSGAQRIHEPQLLLERAKFHGVDPETIKPYVEAFKYGAPPHAGCGIGLERVVMLYLGLGNIRNASMFPRDPKRLFP
ncbi:aspartyl-tRNA synthetase-like protein [Ramicandelaber brevisporus]|nr:aspartyl-tRNA synthetase-like protein [Ramicandelaber brevisporus]